MAEPTDLQPVLPPHQVELGLDTFGDVTVDETGAPRTQAQVLREVVEQGVLADEVGVDAFGLGEHHRDDYAVSAPEIVLGAIASRTRRILLGTAVTVLSSDDPVRVYEKMATLDGVSGGRAEVRLGRGSFVESFPLFGLDLADYERLFCEKLDCSPRCAARDRSAGRARSGGRCGRPRSTPRPRPERCAPGSAWAAPRTRWSGRRGTAS